MPHLTKAITRSLSKASNRGLKMKSRLMTVTNSSVLARVKEKVEAVARSLKYGVSHAQLCAGLRWSSFRKIWSNGVTPTPTKRSSRTWWPMICDCPSKPFWTRSRELARTYLLPDWKFKFYKTRIKSFSRWLNTSLWKWLSARMSRLSGLNNNLPIRKRLQTRGVLLLSASKKPTTSA